MRLQTFIHTRQKVPIQSGMKRIKEVKCGDGVKHSLNTYTEKCSSQPKSSYHESISGMQLACGRSLSKSTVPLSLSAVTSCHACHSTCTKTSTRDVHSTFVTILLKTIDPAMTRARSRRVGNGSCISLDSWLENATASTS